MGKIERQEVDMRNGDTVSVAYCSHCSCCGATIFTDEVCYELKVTAQQWSKRPVNDKIMVSENSGIPFVRDEGFIDWMNEPFSLKMCHDCYSKNTPDITKAFESVKTAVMERLKEKYAARTLTITSIPSQSEPEKSVLVRAFERLVSFGR